MGLKSRTQHQGFTILEFLIVLAVVMVLAGISLIAWDSYYPVFALDQSARNLQLDMELARYRAIYHQNQWIVVFNKRRTPTQTTVRRRVYNYNGSPISGAAFVMSVNSYHVINDDGYRGATGPGAEDSRLYYIGSTAFVDRGRSNGILNRNELVKGPVLLGRGMSLVEQPYPSRPQLRTANEIRFSYRYPLVEVWRSAGGSSRPTNDGGDVFIRNQHWMPGVDSDDNRVHLRRIRIGPNGLVRVTHG